MSSHDSEKKAEELSPTPSFDKNESTIIGMSNEKAFSNNENEENPEIPSDANKDIEAQQPDPEAQKLTGTKLALVFLG